MFPQWYHAYWGVCWLAIIILTCLQHSQGILSYDWDVNSHHFSSSLHSPSFHLLLLPAASWRLRPHPEGSKSCDSAPCPPPMRYRDKYWPLFYLRTRAETWHIVENTAEERDGSRAQHRQIVFTQAPLNAKQQKTKQGLFRLFYSISLRVQRL